jgi:glycosyltransferase involved in cell wall biosynthesis
MAQKLAVSVIVPTLNEADNVRPLLERIHVTFSKAHIPYEVILVDDHSSDQTQHIATGLKNKYPVRVYQKEGKRGKAYSLLEGFERSSYPLVAMIDADLQYPPEELSTMHQLLTECNADIVVTDRKSPQTSPLRKLSTKVYNLVFARMLFGINFDTQSGLKLFKKDILNSFQLTPSPWSFDLEFLIRCLEHKFKIISHTIIFAERSAGVTKVKLLNVTFEMINASLRLRARSSISKVREGYRANNSFLEKAFSVIAVFFIASSFVIFTPSSASAITLENRDQAAGNNILQDLTAWLGLTETNKPSATVTSPTTGTAQPQITQQPTTSPEATALVANNMPSNAPASSTPTTASTATVSTTPQVRVASATSSTSSPTQVAAVTRPDASKLAAATNADNTGSSLYSAQQASNPFGLADAATWSKVLFSAGIISLIFAAFFSVIRPHKPYVRQEINRP